MNKKKINLLKYIKKLIENFEINEKDVFSKYDIKNIPINFSGTGFLLYFDNSTNLVEKLPKEKLYLTLTKYDRRVPDWLEDHQINDFIKDKRGGEYDLPKGRINLKYESNYLNAALRELNEETNLDINAIKDINNLKEINIDNRLLIFAAEFNISEMQNIKLRINKHSRKLEHSNIEFKTFSQITRNIVNNTFIIKSILNLSRL